jgi:SOS response regulatory protein OraA/RecX
LNPADRRRLFQQLLRRGFTPDVIAKALKRDAD